MRSGKVPTSSVEIAISESRSRLPSLSKNLFRDLSSDRNLPPMATAQPWPKQSKRSLWPANLSSAATSSCLEVGSASPTSPDNFFDPFGVSKGIFEYSSTL